MNAAANPNPLLDFSGLPRFDAIRAEHVTEAVDQLIAAARAAVEAVATNSHPATWDTVAEPLAEPLDQLDRAWRAVGHLNAVVSTPEWRSAYHGNLPKVTGFAADRAQDLRLYSRYRELAASPSFAELAAAKQKAVANELRDFRLGGAELPAAEKARLKAVEEELALLAARFDDNLLDATNAWALYVTDRSELDGRARQRPRRGGRCRQGGRQARLETHAADAVLRARVELRGQPRAARLVASCVRHACLGPRRVAGLGQRSGDQGAFSSCDARWPSCSATRTSQRSRSCPKWPRMSTRCWDFCAISRAAPGRLPQRDYAELRAFARTELGLADFAPWDVAYASEKLKAKLFAFSEQEVRCYFPEGKVLSGLFRVAETLYGISIRESRATTWHADVRFFDMHDASGALIGQFYLDNYARPGKQGGAWQDDAVNRRRAGSKLQHPVSLLTCNLSAPTDGAPATFTHDEVITLFHEFGHGLHHLLTRVDVAGVSGIQGVEWDAVELPSQFMENFCWEWDVLAPMTAHVDTGEPLPRALFDRMLAAKNFQSGLSTVRHLEYGLFDMLVHSTHDPGDNASAQSVLDAVRRDIEVVPRASYDRFMESFAHIFAGSYAAGYYSYKWAEVLSADAYSAFEEQGVLSPAAGRRFRDEVLACGGSRDAMASFVAFRGRAPQLDALLRHNGMHTPVTGRSE